MGQLIKKGENKKKVFKKNYSNQKKKSPLHLVSKNNWFEGTFLLLFHENIDLTLKYQGKLAEELTEKKEIKFLFAEHQKDPKLFKKRFIIYYSSPLDLMNTLWETIQSNSMKVFLHFTSFDQEDDRNKFNKSEKRCQKMRETIENQKVQVQILKSALEKNSQENVNEILLSNKKMLENVKKLTSKINEFEKKEKVYLEKISELERLREQNDKYKNGFKKVEEKMNEILKEKNELEKKITKQKENYLLIRKHKQLKDRVKRKLNEIDQVHIKEKKQLKVDVNNIDREKSQIYRDLLMQQSKFIKLKIENLSLNNELIGLPNMIQRIKILENRIEYLTKKNKKDSEEKKEMVSSFFIEKETPKIVEDTKENESLLQVIYGGVMEGKIKILEEEKKMIEEDMIVFKRKLQKNQEKAKKFVSEIEKKNSQIYDAVSNGGESSKLSEEKNQIVDLHKKTLEKVVFLLEKVRSLENSLKEKTEKMGKCKYFQESNSRNLIKIINFCFNSGIKPSLPLVCKRIKKENQKLESLQYELKFSTFFSSIKESSCFLKLLGSIKLVGEDVLLFYEKSNRLRDYLRINHLNLEDKLVLLKDVACALKICHNYKKIHYDVRVDNVFISEKRKCIKIGGFSAMKDFSDRDKYKTFYDVVLFGCLMFEIIFEKKPFREEFTSSFEFEDSKLKPTVKNFVFEIIHKHTDQRISDTIFKGIESNNEKDIFELIKDCVNEMPSNKLSFSIIIKRIEEILENRKKEIEKNNEIKEKYEENKAKLGKLLKEKEIESNEQVHQITENERRRKKFEEEVKAINVDFVDRNLKDEFDEVLKDKTEVIKALKKLVFKYDK